MQTSLTSKQLMACDGISHTFGIKYLDAGVGAGQLGELDAAAVVHVPQAHLTANTVHN